MLFLSILAMELRYLKEGESCLPDLGQCGVGLTCHPLTRVCSRCAEQYQFCSRLKPCCVGNCRILCT